MAPMSSDEARTGETRRARRETAGRADAETAPETASETPGTVASQGQVVAVADDGLTFTVEIDEVDGTGTRVSTDLPLDVVPADERDLVQAGATFDIWIKEEDGPDPITLRLRRLRVTPESVAAGHELAASLHERFDVRGLRGDGTSRTQKTPGEE